MSPESDLLDVVIGLLADFANHFDEPRTLSPSS